MVETNIKALTQLIGKPLKDWDASDVDKIVDSDQRELLMDIDTVEHIVSNSNQTIEDICTPIYAQLSFNETSDYVEGLLKAYYDSLSKDEEGNIVENKEEKANLKSSMLNMMESDGVMEVLSASYVLFHLFADVDLAPFKDKICKSLRRLEDIAVILPFPAGIGIFEKVLNLLYFPLITAWKDRFNEPIIEENQEFRSKLDEYSQYLEEVTNNFIQEQAEKMAHQAMMEKGIVPTDEEIVDVEPQESVGV